MNVWIHWEGRHYHLIKNCGAVDEEYNEVDWKFASEKGYVPCPICHSKNLKVTEAKSDNRADSLGR